MKQTTNNPKEKSLTKGWQLFALISEAFPPSHSLLPYVLCSMHNMIISTIIKRGIIICMCCACKWMSELSEKKRERERERHVNDVNLSD